MFSSKFVDYERLVDLAGFVPNMLTQVLRRGLLATGAFTVGGAHRLPPEIIISAPNSRT